MQSLLGRGGFADVYLYRQKRPERKVAVKVLRELGSREGRQVFTTEADALAATCAHPAILSLYQTGKLPDGRPYLVLQYCPVTNLSQRVRRSPLPLKEALDITIRLTGALETIHRAGLAHRDMKPANVLISEFSTPVLSDFGLALPLGKPLAHRDVLGLSVPWAPRNSTMKTLWRERLVIFIPWRQLCIRWLLGVVPSRFLAAITRYLR